MLIVVKLKSLTEVEIYTYKVIWKLLSKLSGKRTNVWQSIRVIYFPYNSRIESVVSVVEYFQTSLFLLKT